MRKNTGLAMAIGMLMAAAGCDGATESLPVAPADYSWLAGDWSYRWEVTPANAYWDAGAFLGTMHVTVDGAAVDGTLDQPVNAADAPSFPYAAAGVVTCCEGGVARLPMAMKPAAARSDVSPVLLDLVLERGAGSMSGKVLDATGADTGLLFEATRND